MDINTDKSSHLIVSNGDKLQSILDEINKSPLQYNNQTIKENDKEKWLGDIFQKSGLEASIEATIKDRIGRVKISIFETNAILDDIRMQIIGGINGSIDIWERAIIPMLLNNSETWVNISEDHELT